MSSKPIIDARGPPKISNVILRKTVGFSVIGVPGSIIAVNIERIPPLAISTAKHFEIWFGLNEAPPDGITVQVSMLPIAVATPPGFAASVIRAAWNGVQHWELLTAVGVVQTITHEDVLMLERARNYSTMDLADRIRDSAWSILVTNTTQTQIFIGTLTLEHNLEIRSWGGDLFTWDDDPDELKDGISEIDTDFETESGP